MPFASKSVASICDGNIKFKQGTADRAPAVGKASQVSGRATINNFNARAHRFTFLFL